ncbi:MAG: oligosaccharide flippase family protein [Calditrichaceae bacterium]|nr:oligosaccharide flippase family protein [Calditrichaceae bacterium]MBN2708172.1 oligosaccharide flippase family protein [Calditrichaceae bacterium]RQV97170.1 MAG: flippase [Calditrichota bacterium]
MTKIYTFFNKHFYNKTQKTLFENIFFLSILQFFNYFLPLITIPYLFKILGVEKFGVIMLANAIALSFIIITDYGFNRSGTREIAVNKNNPDKIEEIFSSIMFIKFLLLILSFFILLLIVNIIPSFKKESIIYYYSFGVVIGQVLFPVWYFQGIEKMKVISFLTIFAKIIYTILIFVIVKSANDYIFVPVLNSLGYITSGLIGIFIVLKSGVHFSIPNYRNGVNRFKESSLLFFANVSFYLNNSANIIIIGLLTNQTLTGIYAGFEKIIFAIKNMAQPIEQALFPYASSRSNDKVQRITRIFQIFNIAFFSIIAGIVYIFSYPILNTFLDISTLSYIKEFHLFLVVIIIHSIAAPIYGIYFPALKLYDLRLKVILVSGIVNFVLAIILTLYFKLIGVIFAIIISEVILLFISFYYYSNCKKSFAETLTK